MLSSPKPQANCCQPWKPFWMTGGLVSASLLVMISPALRADDVIDVATEPDNANPVCSDKSPGRDELHLSVCSLWADGN
jgi:hypothetical protein